MRALGFVVFAIAAVACDPPVAPTSPRAQPEVLLIVPPVGALKVGAVEAVSAVVLTGQNMRETVPATWESDAPDVVSVTSVGYLEAKKLGTAMIRSRFGEMVATQPVSVVPDFDGNWVGRYQVVGCARLSGAGPDLCRYELTGGGAMYGFGLTLSQPRAQVSAVLELHNNVGHVSQVGELEAVLAPPQAIQLNGTVRATFSEGNLRTIISDWSTSLTETGSEMVGRFTRTSTFDNFWGSQQIRMECVVLNLRRTGRGTT